MLGRRGGFCAKIMWPRSLLGASSIRPCSAEPGLSPIHASYKILP